MNGSAVGVRRVLLAGGLLAITTGAGWAIHNSAERNLAAVGNRQQADVPSSYTSKSTANTAAAGAPSSPKSSPLVPNVGEPGQDGKFSVTIRKPAGPPLVDLGTHGALGGQDAAGKPLIVACSNCHTGRLANTATRESADLDEFHQGMVFAHGNVTCISCHNPNNYDTLHLADGSPVKYSEVMTLCAQCHGPKTRDYQHGAHGGMTGYWNLSRGPRTKNNCVDCHPPHAPQFPAMKPTFKPRDRFLDVAVDHEKGRPGVSSHE